jgi:hypothetical protein
MSDLTIENSLAARLSELDSTTAIRDESGRVVGFFVPAAEAGSLLSASDGCPYTPEELARLRNEIGGKQLSQIWKRLGRA